VATVISVLAEWGMLYGLESAYVDLAGRTHLSDRQTTQLIADQWPLSISASPRTFTIDLSFAWGA
jgi:hypothetical protein